MVRGEQLITEVIGLGYDPTPQTNDADQALGCTLTSSCLEN